MGSFPHRAVNRRRFFVIAARTGTLLVLTTFATWQEVKRRRLANDPNCIRLLSCADCVEFDRCSKPKAVSARKSGLETSLFAD